MVKEPLALLSECYLDFCFLREKRVQAARLNSAYRSNRFRAITGARAVDIFVRDGDPVAAHLNERPVK